MDAVAKLFDPYNREARVFPALIVLTPVILVAAFFFPKVFLEEFPKNVLAGLLFLAIFYMLAGMARSAGKQLEPKLFEAWGGVPTTVLLRHADTTIDATTKARYHKALSAMADNIDLPNGDDEAADRVAADAVYASAVSALRERRRGEAWDLQLKENAAYGFRRNMLGLRAVAITIALTTSACFGLLTFFQGQHQASVAAVLATIIAAPRFAIFCVLDIAIAATWAVGVRRPWVRTAAYTYANGVLRTLDMPS